MTDKIMYIVKGSEDGNLGVYSSKKKAYERTCAYLQNGFEKKLKLESYAKFCAGFDPKHRFHHFHIVSATSDCDSTYVDVAEFVLDR